MLQETAGNPLDQEFFGVKTVTHHCVPARMLDENVLGRQLYWEASL